MPGLGWKPSHHDPRDLPLKNLLGAAVAPPPRSEGLRSYLGQLLDQGDMEGCVGWSFANGLWARWNYLAALSNQPSPVAQPSAMWAWWLARQTEGNDQVNIGCIIRDAFKQIAKVGIASELQYPSQPADDTMPDGLPRWASPPSVAAFQHAADQRFPLGYYRLDLDDGGPDLQTKVMMSISQGYPVQFGTLISNAFMALGPHAPQDPPGLSDVIAGGHSLTALYYDEQGIYGPNNWNSTWGNAGWFALSWRYLLWFQTSDVWATDAGLPAKGWA